MAVVDVQLSVWDVALLSEHFEITQQESSTGIPVFQGDLGRLDFAFLRVGWDAYKVVKARKPLAGRHAPQDRLILQGARAVIAPPVDGWDKF